MKMWTKAAAALTVLSLTHSFASALTVRDDDTGFVAEYQQSVVPFFKDIQDGGKGVSGTFQGMAGVEIHYRTFINPNAKAKITLLPGSGETYEKYAEVIYDLYGKGYSVFVLDHRGQGHSGRMLSDATKQYVDSFDNFVADVKTFHDQIVEPAAPAQSYLLAHSMGGAIAAYYLELYPKDFAAAVLSAPMLQIRLDGYAEPLALILLAARELLGQGTDFVKPPLDPLNAKFDDSALTHSPARWTLAHEIWLNNPSLRLVGPTNHWLREALSSSLAVRSPDWAHEAQLPILILQSLKDSLVDPAGQASFCNAAPACTLKQIAGARHEILMEVDSIRSPALQEIDSFFGAHSN